MSVAELSIDEIKVTGWNPRKTFDQKALEELAASIKEHGIIEPLVVRQVNGSYELVAGERRLRAAKLAGLDKVPVVIKELSDQEVKELMLLENLQREDLNPIEEAQAIKTLLDEGNITQEELGKRLGKSQAWIANRLRLLKAPKSLKDLLISREISPKHVMVLLPYVNYAVFKQKILPELKEQLKQGPVSVRDLQDMIRRAVLRDWNHEFALCLTDFPYEFHIYREFFDMSSCNGCKHVFEFKAWNEKEKFCLNRQCWKDKINRAKHKYEKEREKFKENDVIDTSVLNFSEYEYIKLFSFDKSECESCEHKKKDTDGNPICLNPECLRKKVMVWRREENKKERERKRKAWEEVDRRLSDVRELSTKDLRFIVKNLSWLLWSESVKKALKPWKGKSENVPDEELPKALMRLVVADILIRKYDISVEKVEEIFSELEG